ncbi:transglycosylase domain-containing protein [Brevibacillus borstelensis]|uniref:transglycosylase domain-containing protein n=1 Tax=Brevibacillus borstelensis TaxID=45462 RepID=UPI000468B92F|nr:PBP1A family penicillin-binding protein [Brevibacillus borstelensis]
MAAKARQRVKKKNKMLLFAVSFVIFLFLSVIGGYFSLLYAGEKMIDTTKLEDLKAEPSIIYDKNGKEMMSLVRQKNSDYVPFSQISPMLIDALLSVEDKRFYEHKGIDMIRIGGAIINDIQKGSLAEGGSTITQQLARRVFLSLEKTFWRKTKEVSIAIALERNYSKDQILEMYLNQIYFGEGVYGVGDAAKLYFDKKPSDLTISEAAMLAAIPKAPSTYSPFANPEKAKERRDTILRLMYEDGHITNEQKEKAQAEPLPKEHKNTTENSSKNVNRAFIDYVFREAEARYNVTEEELYRGGWSVYTTLEPNIQDAMVKAYANEKNFPKPGPKRAVESAMVVVDAKNGGIAALMGGRNYTAKGFNYATDMARQPGSSFKPLAVYAPAIDTDIHKWNAHSMLSNKRQSFNGYEPRNYNGKYSESISMMRALINSDNVPAVWLLNEIGVKTGMNYIEKFGIELSPDDRNLAIALGGLSKGTSPLKMAQAYTTFANGGVMAEAHIIEKLENQRSGVEHVFEAKENRVLKPEAAWEVHTMLERAVQEGTGRAAKISGRPVAGKTGTTQSIAGDSGVNKDAWFVGYTPEYVGAVWMGFDPEDKQHLMRQGSSLTAKMFSMVLGEGLKGVKSRGFEPPAGIQRQQEEEKEEVLPVQLAADMTLDEDKLKVVLSWIGGSPDYTYDVYRFTDNPENREKVASGLREMSYVDTLNGPTMYKYIVVPRDADGEEKTPSNVAEINMSQLENLLREGEHHDDGQMQDGDIPIDGGMDNGEWPGQGNGNGGNGQGNGNGGNNGNGNNGQPDGQPPVAPPDIVPPGEGDSQSPPQGIELPPPPDQGQQPGSDGFNG